ncbi:hypothetical protein NDU88_005371 [Pleurodeles waltl]|uniref:Uncharacterized protein n=1 Tax=Pleurodeles waltl TaxID=8319 RepID=A0AAV7QI45_PLEWA|nr:hypothetical protein NDU88_005371 [Pleurodeles waltl]
MRAAEQATAPHRTLPLPLSACLISPLRVCLGARNHIGESVRNKAVGQCPRRSRPAPLCAEPALCTTCSAYNPLGSGLGHRHPVRLRLRSGRSLLAPSDAPGWGSIVLYDYIASSQASLQDDGHAIKKLDHMKLDHGCVEVSQIP